MISCVFAYAKGTETQSTEVELNEPMAALFIVRNDGHARAALRAWLSTQQDFRSSRHTSPRARDGFAPALPARAA